ncbi:MAG TPA: BppU family phage baseplate upper protein, partial [Clostridium sp.]
MIKPIEHYINIDLATKINVNQSIVIPKSDTNSHKFIINVFNNSVSYNLTDTTSKIYLKKSDGTVVFLNCVIDSTITNQLSVLLSTQAVTAVGQVASEITIYGTAGEVLTSVTFNFTVNEITRDDSAIESTSEFTALTDALAVIASIENKAEKSYVDANLAIVNSSLADIPSQIAVKVDKVTGKDLSTNDYNNTEKTEVAKVASKRDKLTPIEDVDISQDLRNKMTGMTPVNNSLPANASVTLPSLDGIVRSYSYPFQTNCNFTKSGSPEFGASLRDGIIDVQLIGADSSKNYSISQIQRKNGTISTIDVWDSDSYGIVCSFYATNYTEPVGVDTLTLVEMNASGITGTIKINWSKFLNPCIYQSLIFSNAGLHKSTYANVQIKINGDMRRDIDLARGLQEIFLTTLDYTHKFGISTITRQVTSGANKYSQIDLYDYTSNKVLCSWYQLNY